MDRRRPRPQVPGDDRPGRSVELHIDKVVAEGDGLARRDDGKVVFVSGALPGEQVLARITKESRDYARAEVVEIHRAHDQRVIPPCEHVAEGCGGCDLQHASVALQLELKRQIVVESLVRLGRIPDPQVRAIPSRVVGDRGRRTTVRVAAGADGVGFRRRMSHDIVAIESCLTAHPLVNRVVADLVLRVGAEAVVRVSSTTGEVAVWAEPPDDVIRCPAGVAVGPGAIVHENVAGVGFQISAASFFQSSPGAAEELVDAVARALGPVETWPLGSVVDAYGGVGLFAATVVPADRHVVLVESNAAAVADARVNLAGRSVEFEKCRVEDWTASPAGIVIADPARDGLKSAGVHALVAGQPQVLVLVSCDPASLGRDARLLGEAGYRFDGSDVLDVFPHTHHIEVVSRFTRVQTPTT